MQMNLIENSDLLLGSELVNAWSVNGETLSSPDFAANLFASSLFPYLLLLFFLSRKETNTPKLGNFGFQFLLVFVGATIPAGIIAKSQYGDTLANVDFLHGLAESMLTVTNLLIISGFRLPRPSENFSDLAKSATATIKEFSEPLLVLIPALLVYFVNSNFGNALSYHTEPPNALSLPTWVVHTSSLLEWLVAMKLIWEYAEISGNPRWKGMTWGMIPSHASGICACTYHFFYNNPAVVWMVTLQAALTVIGNTTMAAAAYRIYSYEKDKIAGENNIGMPPESSSDSENIAPVENGVPFWTNMFVKSVLVAALLKYGELYLDVPFNHNSFTALSIVTIPTLLNILKWSVRSKKEENIIQAV